jgi:hypothetical protein
MRRLRTFLGLSRGDQWLLVGVALLLGATRLGLWLLPFPAVRRIVARAARPVRGEAAADPSALGRLAWAVAVASRAVPRATCLTQALAAQVLLRRRGYPAALRIGVARGAGGRFEAHAWVESEGRVIVGAAPPGRYTPLPALEGDRP